MASHTVLHARPARGPVRGSAAGAHIPDAALPCQRRPDVFQHPLLEASTDIPDASPDTSPEQRHQHLVLLRTARDLCASCPLWAECLQDAVAHAEPYGYAAATTLEDRRWIRRALAIGDPNGNLPTHPTDGPASTAGTGTGSGDTSRRLLRLRSRTTDAAARYAAERGLPELEQVLDAFDARQDQLASYQRQLPAIPRQLHEHTTAQGAHRHPHPHAHPESRSEDMAAAESGQRIAFSYEDPAQAVRQALLAPLVRSALPTLDSLEQLVTMLASVPGGDIAPELPDNLRAARKAVEALAPEGAQGSCDYAAPAMDASGGPLRVLTGSVSVELATTDPVAALRRDFLEPLLRELASSLANIEKVATMLAATSDGDEVHLEPIRTALQGIRARLPHPTTSSGSGGTTTGTRHSAPHPAQATAPSIRAAVETAVSTFPGPFSARDVLRALPPGIYGDPSKTISNVLSALVKSGRLQRLARGTYARTVDVAMDVTADVPDQDEAKSA
ncbi:WhiB family transcriptional regulator [Streptomyces sp. ME18-1-4]|uniref:WhiB family transcriptional regulator n=1 Tax=Streptomyces sp. ME18-1-4 TaxID=3028685 RepID=UPI0029A9A919|nr:WhiB family transcriptional regulator [Streptomyces sp. ME18-1-4]MDX3248277.1 WhiB family transcriptional regulator [Streptomyces sp. ME18-1-4]